MNHPIVIGEDGRFEELVLSFDNVLFVPHATDTTKIVIPAGGKFTLADGTVKTFASETMLDIDTDLTVDDTLTAGVFYSIWSNGTVTKFSDDSSAAPSDVPGGRCLRAGIHVWDNDGTKEVLPFVFDGTYYEYQTAVEGSSEDATNVFSDTMNTTFLVVDCSAFVPENILKVRVVIQTSTVATPNRYHYCRQYGATHDGHLARCGDYWRSDKYEIRYSRIVGEYEPTVLSGRYEAKNNYAYSTGISVVGFYV